MGAAAAELRWAAGHPAVAHTFVDALDEAVTVAGAAGHHLARVRRLRAGEVVTASAGSREWRPYRVEAVDRGAVKLLAAGATSLEPDLAPGLAVAFAITKGDKPERVVQHLTELGVDRIVPVFARRSVTRWRGERIDGVLDRLRRVAREAAGQCRRAVVPTVEAPVELAELTGHRGVIVADRAAPCGARVPEPVDGEWLALVGPEGGFAPGELGGFEPAGRVGIGPHVLRAETAAVAIAAVLATERR